MAPTYHFRGVGQTDTETDITPRFRLYELDVSMSAEEGESLSSTVIADDHSGDFDIAGHRRFVIRETSAPSNQQVTFVGYTAARRIKRGEFHRTTDARIWEIDLVDVNSILERRVFDTAAADRPAETDAARIAWLLSVEETQLIDDDTYFSATDPVQMDAADYVGQTVEAVLNDCAQQSGKNYFVWFNEDGTGEGLYSLFYDFAAGSNYSSSLSLSNVLADVDDTTVFAYSVVDSEMTLDPSRVYSGVKVDYDGGFVYLQRQATAEAFARRDTTMAAENVKTETTARRRATRYLESISTEEVTLTLRVELPAAKVNALMQGMRVQVKSTHFPDFTGYVWLRCISRQVQQISEEKYALTVTLVGPSPVTLSCPNLTAAGNYYPLGGSGSTPNPSDGVTYYLRPGIAWPVEPDPGHIGSLHFPIYGSGGVGTHDEMGTCVQNRVRTIVVGDGTLTLNTATNGVTVVNMSVTVKHKVGIVETIDEVQTGVSGDSFVVNISSHNGVNCTHYIDVRDTGPCGTGWRWLGSAWAV